MIHAREARFQAKRIKQSMLDEYSYLRDYGSLDKYIEEATSEINRAINRGVFNTKVYVDILDALKEHTIEEVEIICLLVRKELEECGYSTTIGESAKGYVINISW